MKNTNEIHELADDFEIEFGSKLDRLIKKCYSDLLILFSNTDIEFDSQRTRPTMMHDAFRTRISRAIREGMFPELVSYEHGKKFYIIYKQAMLIDFSIANDRFITSTSSNVSKEFESQKPLDDLPLPMMLHAHLCYTIHSTGVEISTTALTIPKNVGHNLHIRILNEHASNLRPSAETNITRETPMDKLKERRAEYKNSTNTTAFI